MRRNTPPPAGGGSAGSSKGSPRMRSSTPRAGRATWRTSRGTILSSRGTRGKGRRDGPAVGFHVTPLRSGSSGNLTLVEHAGTVLLVDAGLPSQRDLVAALSEVDRGWEDVDALLVSHLHGDHVNGSAVGCCARFEIPIHLHRKNLDGFSKKVLSRSPGSGPVRTFQ